MVPDISKLKEEYPIESLLSARQILSPKLVGNKIYFISNMSGMYSLYEMDKSGSMPIPLILDGIALQNPHLMAGELFSVFPKLSKILLLVDTNGDELYQPCFVSLDGGIPKPIFGDKYAGHQFMFFNPDISNNIVYFMIDDRKSPGYELLRVNLEDLSTKSYGKTPMGKFLVARTEDHNKLVHMEMVKANDHVLYYHDVITGEDKLILGIPLDQRSDDYQEKLNGTSQVHFVENNNAIIGDTLLFDQLGGLFRLPLDRPDEVKELPIKGLTTKGELTTFTHITDDYYCLEYNVDGCSIVYHAKYITSDQSSTENYMQIVRPLIGMKQPVTQGVQLGIHFDSLIMKHQGKIEEFVFSFTKATMPSQLFLATLEGENGVSYTQLSQERVLGIPEKSLSEGEDASFDSFDGLKVSARLYRPSNALGYEGARPLVVFIHGGPQSQERPDFTWFSMPLIQYLTLHGFAVFVPNVRGSTGYGVEYSSKITKDWGGDDRLDHVEALKVLEKDPLIDSTKRAVVGRSYGGYMTLTLTARHPELWKAGCDMFGPYDLFGFYDRLPPTWQTIFDNELGHPEKEKDFYIERSPKTYIGDITAPLLVIQGKNDPRVLLAESEEIVETLKKQGKTTELLVFEDEGHDVIKFKNRVKCYQTITQFFLEHLG
ncbi:MAG: alpha/beta fold hydrolase [Candidatus Kariarchaeaceae archaeon]|jgi:pimeloyl-ACP methyl ester carboxylesterase